MSTASMAAAGISGAQSALQTAISSSGKSNYTSLMALVASNLAPILASPDAAVSQAAADDLGSSLQYLRADIDRNGDADLATLEDDLHNRVSQACVDFQPDIDWYQAAGVPRPSKRAQTRAGVKHEPAPSQQ